MGRGFYLGLKRPALLQLEPPTSRGRCHLSDNPPAGLSFSLWFLVLFKSGIPKMCDDNFQFIECSVDSGTLAVKLFDFLKYRIEEEVNI